MYVKKWLALTLAGAVLAMGFSGCDRTIIEHQFHTDTITETVTNTEYVQVENEAILGLQKLVAFFDNHNSPYTQVNYRHVDLSGESGESGAGIEEALPTYGDQITSDDVKEFVEKSGMASLVMKKKCADISELFPNFLEAADEIVEAFNNLDDDTISLLEEKLTENAVYIYAVLIYDSEDATNNYAVIQITCQ